MMLALPDVNVLVALVAEQHEHHAAAHRWFRETRSWATTPLTEAGLIRLILNPAVVGASHDAGLAIRILEQLRRQGDHRFLPDASSLTDTTIDLAALVGHRQVTDFHLVNLAASHDAVLATFDARLFAALAPADQRWVSVIPV
jgi:toxin-antitoxin system PIN domain toxin